VGHSYIGIRDYDEYVLNSLKNDNRCVLSCYTSSHVFFVCDFDSITSLFSDHTVNIGVTEKNEVTLSKLRTKDAQELA
jgi:hypothetical protein